MMSMQVAGPVLPVVPVLPVASTWAYRKGLTDWLDE